ncbi:MAG: transcriptional regulator, partial [Pseudomonadota bacterium]|nr:transcriptional regulator [Pseudomonadota bacterium]
LGVLIFDGLERRRLLRSDSAGLRLTRSGEKFFLAIGIDTDGLAGRRRALCRACLDWSMRRHHLAGALGAALLTRCFELGWARRAKGSRIVDFSASGEKALRQRFRPDDDCDRR